MILCIPTSFVTLKLSTSPSCWDWKSGNNIMTRAYLPFEKREKACMMLSCSNDTMSTVGVHLSFETIGGCTPCFPYEPS